MFRMTFEDVFLIRNRGVVATGRVGSGTLRVDDTVQIDDTLDARVDGIDAFRKSIGEATAGQHRRAVHGHRKEPARSRIRPHRGR
jgi:translation elongation factor EF-Tu-like GTPase